MEKRPLFWWIIMRCYKPINLGNFWFPNSAVLEIVHTRGVVVSSTIPFLKRLKGNPTNNDEVYSIPLQSTKVQVLQSIIIYFFIIIILIKSIYLQVISDNHASRLVTGLVPVNQIKSSIPHIQNVFQFSTT